MPITCIKEIIRLGQTLGKRSLKLINSQENVIKMYKHFWLDWLSKV